VNVGIALCLDFCLRRPRALPSRLLRARPLVAIGLGSYSLYLWQELFLNRHQAGVLQSFPLNVACAAAVAAASYFLVERPSLRLRARAEARLFPGRPAKATAVAGPL
jgi:peptidoglycan/LPS O-acetylase OafA/YrhL